MKKTICITMLMIMSVSVFSQNTPVIQTDYLQKSKNQKTAAWILLGGGAVLIGTGFLVGDRKESSFSDAGTGVVLGGVGFLSTLGSIPLFIASGKNKRKANASTSFKMETMPVLQQHAFVKHSFPAIAMKIRL